MLATAMLLGVASRICYSWNAPFWFDETYSGVIASQPNPAALVSWCLHELTGPAYYMPLWVWEKLAGNSNLALRLPSLLCALAAPLVIFLRGSWHRDVRLFWATFVLLWLPAQVVSFEARPYPQLFLLATIQAIVFLRLMKRPSRARAAWWAGLSACAILTSYNAVVISGIQGALYLAHHRKNALSTWPALLAFVPVAGWIGLHLPFLILHTTAHTQAYAAVPLGQITNIPAWLLGLPLHGTIALGTIAVSCGLRARHRGIRAPASPEAMLALSGMAAVATVLLLAFIRPGFAPRYLTPAMPAALFAMAWWARRVVRIDPKPVLIVVTVLMIAAGRVLRSSLTERDGDVRHLFNMERPSIWLAEERLRRVVFLWDGPVGAAADPQRLAQVAGFFFDRAKIPVPVTVLRLTAEADPNHALLAAAKEPGTAVMWIANDRLGGKHEPHLAQLDPRRICRDFGEGQVIVTACRPTWRQAARSASTVRPVAETSAKPPSIAIVSGSPFSVR